MENFVDGASTGVIGRPVKSVKEIAILRDKTNEQQKLMTKQSQIKSEIRLQPLRVS